MSADEWKEGDKVRVTGPYVYQVINSLVFFSVGDILELVCGNSSSGPYYEGVDGDGFVCFRHNLGPFRNLKNQSYLSIKVSCIEKLNGSHKCICPSENFTLNGRGCVCGGI